MTILAAVSVLFDSGHMTTTHALRDGWGFLQPTGRYTVGTPGLYFSRSMSKAELIDLARWIAEGCPDAPRPTASPGRYGQGNQTP